VKEQERIVYSPEKKTHIVTPKDKEFEASTPKEEAQKPKKEKKPKEPKQAVEPKSALFPAEAKINKYGFIFISSDIADAFGYTKGQEMRISIDFKDGALIIKKT